jgi:adenylate kinase family enzyme
MGPSPDGLLDALLLVGPTGAGKSPLGRTLEQRGLWGRPCVHFDFGANLREIVAQDQPDDWIGPDDIAFLRRVLQSGALLEDEQFPLAARILKRFLRRRAVGGDPWIVLNGLPRHVGQAQGVGSILHVRLTVQLACSAEVVLQRIRGNVDGDRTLRSDDDEDLVRRKLLIFMERTSPLLDYYRRHGAWEVTVQVAANMGSVEMWEALPQPPTAHPQWRGFAFSAKGG